MTSYILIFSAIAIAAFITGFINGTGYGKNKTWKFVLKKYNLFPKEIPAAAKTYAREMKYIDKRKELVAIDGGKK